MKNKHKSYKLHRYFCRLNLDDSIELLNKILNHPIENPMSLFCQAEIDLIIINKCNIMILNKLLRIQCTPIGIQPLKEGHSSPAKSAS